jgi:hypothetical protein
MQPTSIIALLLALFVPTSEWLAQGLAHGWSAGSARTALSCFTAPWRQNGGSRLVGTQRPRPVPIIRHR